MRNLSEPARSCIFSVMCDEYTDVSNKQKLTFYMRCLNNDLEVSEKFLGFYEIPDKKRSTNVTAMKDILLRYQLNLDMWRGQCYDGTSNILVKSFGVATKIFAEQSKAHYTHCHAHLLLLSVKNVTKNIKIL